MDNPDRLTKTLTSVGTAFVEDSINCPLRFYITRVRAEVIEGNATQVAVSIRESYHPTNDIGVTIEYDLTTDPLDSGEYVFFKSSSVDDTNELLGVIYFAAKCDTADNTVLISLDIEPRY